MKVKYKTIAYVQLNKNDFQLLCHNFFVTEAEDDDYAVVSAPYLREQAIDLNDKACEAYRLVAEIFKELETYDGDIWFYV